MLCIIIQLDISVRLTYQVTTIIYHHMKKKIIKKKEKKILGEKQLMSLITYIFHYFL